MYQRRRESEGRLRKSRYLRGQDRVLVWLPGLERLVLSPSGYMGDGDRQKGKGNDVQEGYINQMQVMAPWIEPWLIVELLNEESGRGASRSGPIQILPSSREREWIERFYLITCLAILEWFRGQMVQSLSTKSRTYEPSIICQQDTAIPRSPLKAYTTPIDVYTGKSSWKSDTNGGEMMLSEPKNETTTCTPA